MGISGLLPLLQSVQKTVHIREYSGRTVAVDGNVWMHKGAFSCAVELALDRPTTKYIDYFMNQIGLLTHHGVKPLVVFDGQPLAAKRCTNEDRNQKRDAARKKGLELWKQGHYKEATDQFQRAVCITSHMIQQVAKALSDKCIEYIVAPYEADAQLTYLVRTHKAAIAITEDSDLIVFGCPVILYKMNAYGEGRRIEHKDVFRAKDINLTGWNMTQFRHMCILSGCDYLPNLPGIGLKTAHKLLKQFGTIDMVLRHLRLQGKMRLVSDYESGFHLADRAFLYQRVYDMDRRISLPLTFSFCDPSFSHTTTMVTAAALTTTKITTSATNTAKLIHKPEAVKTNKSKLYPSDLETNKENIPPWACLEKTTPHKSPPSQDSKLDAPCRNMVPTPPTSKVLSLKPTHISTKASAASTAVSAASVSTETNTSKRTTLRPALSPVRSASAPAIIGDGGGNGDSLGGLQAKSSKDNALDLLMAFNRNRSSNNENAARSTDKGKPSSGRSEQRRVPLRSALKAISTNSQNSQSSQSQNHDENDPQKTRALAKKRPIEALSVSSLENESSIPRNSSSLSSSPSSLSFSSKRVRTL